MRFVLATLALLLTSCAASAVDVPTRDEFNALSDRVLKLETATPVPIPPDPIPIPPSVCATRTKIVIEQSAVPSAVLETKLVDCAEVVLDGDWVDAITIAKNNVIVRAKTNAEGFTLRPRLRDKVVGDKGVVLVQGAGTRIMGLELSGARSSDGNGAAIRHEGVGLSLFDVYIHDSQMGVLSGNLSAARPVANDDVTIERSRIEKTGGADGPSHPIYMGSVLKSLTLLTSEIVEPVEGHALKFRSGPATVLIDGSVLSLLSGSGSRVIDASNGGKMTITRSVLQMSGPNQNSDMIGWRREDAWTLPTTDAITISDTWMIADHDHVAQLVYGGQPAITFGANVKIVGVFYDFIIGRTPEGANIPGYPYTGTPTRYRGVNNDGSTARAQAGLPPYDGTFASIPRPPVTAGLVTPMRGAPIPPPNPIPIPPGGAGWSEVPNSDISKVAGSFAIIPWVTMSFDPAKMELHSNHPGGHGDGSCNADYRYKLNDPRGWVKWSICSPLDANYQPTDAIRPRSAHGWGGHVYVPTLGCVFFNDSALYPYGYEGGQQAGLACPDSLSWQMLTPLVNNGDPHVMYDKARDLVFNFKTKVEQFDPKTKVLSFLPAGGADNILSYGSGTYCGTTALYMGAYEGAMVITDMRDLTKLDRKAVFFKNVPSAPSGIVGAGVQCAKGKFLFWIGGRELYTLDQATMTFSTIANAAGPAPPTQTPAPAGGILGRFQCTDDQCFGINWYPGNVWTVKLAP